jgi:[protein-PII] uridylyltransferase
MDRDADGTAAGLVVEHTLSTTSPASSAVRFQAAREAIIGAQGLPAAQRRRALSDVADRRISDLLGSSPPPGTSVVAVGGYGRRELLPGSDLDIVLVHDGTRSPEEVGAVADAVLYPLWDSGVPLDHSVRTPDEAAAVARSDLKVALGLLDARHVAGDPELTRRLAEASLADWRKLAAARLPELHEAVQARTARCGELAYLIEPDLVESYGGLRDTLVLRAIAASWVADWPHSTIVEESRSWLLTVRDALHRSTRRRSDRMLLQEQDDVASLLELLDADVLLRRVSEAGRAIGYASDVTWRSVQRALRSRTRRHLLSRRPTRRPLADGVVEYDGEAVLARKVDLEHDATLAVRAAAVAAQAGVPLAVATLERLVVETPDLPVPWPAAARDAFVRLLGAGRDGIPVWEDLEAAGLVVRWLPDWERIRHRPQRTPIHRHTVDRHSIEAVAEAAALARRVARPDLLLMGALLHDVGKGWPGDHSATGAVMAESMAARMGFDDDDVHTISELVRHHLLLPMVATTRDLDDPATTTLVADLVGSAERLELLSALTEADARAAGSLAWTPWRAALVRDLVRRVHARLADEDDTTEAGVSFVEPWARTLASSGAFEVLVSAPDVDQICRVTVVAPDRVGLLACAAGVLALHRLEVRGASVDTIDGSAVQVWRTVSMFGPPPDDQVLRQDLMLALEGSLDISGRLERRSAERRRSVIRTAPPRVQLLTDASQTASVLQVRAHDEPGLLHRVARVVADIGVAVRSAVVDTLGADVVDVFYLVGDDGGPVNPEVAELVRDRVCEALEGRA